MAQASDQLPAQPSDVPSSPTPGPNLRRELARYGLAVVASLGLHLLVPLASSLSIGLTMETPEFDLEFETIEFIDPNLLQGAIEAEPEPAGPAVLSASGSAGANEGTESGGEETETGETGESETAAEGESDTTGEEEEPEKPKFAEKNSKVDKLGPANSTFFALLANRRIARLPYAEQAIDLIAPLPDFQFIIQGAGFHPWRDFDYIVIASSDIRDWSQTFLAVQSKLSQAEIRAGLEIAAKKRDQAIEWVTRKGVVMGNPKPIDPARKDRDPRWFVFLDRGVAMYVREEFLPQVLAGPKKGKSSGNFVANIARMRRFTAQHPKAGLQVKFNDMRAALKRVRNLPIEFPNDLELFAEATRNPELVVRFRFLEEAQAADAERFWRKSVGSFIKGDFFRRQLFGTMYDRTGVERTGEQLELRNRFNADQTKALMKLMADMANRQMRRNPTEMDAARREREALWKLRENGKLPPSKARERLEAQRQAADGTKQ